MATGVTGVRFDWRHRVPAKAVCDRAYRSGGDHYCENLKIASISSSWTFGSERRMACVAQFST